MSKHTPGPWRVTSYRAESNIKTAGIFYIYSAFYAEERSIRNDVCEVLAQGRIGQQESNARLIAAAPDMLEALRNCLESIEAQWHWEPVKQARAAIAKATGKEVAR